MFENNFVLTQEELFGKRKTVILDFEDFLLWRDWLDLQNVHKVVNFIEEFVSIWKHVFKILKPVLWGPILPRNVPQISGRLEKLIFKKLNSDIGSHEVAKLFVRFDNIDLGFCKKSRQIMNVSRFLPSFGINFKLELIESLDKGQFARVTIAFPVIVL